MKKYEKIMDELIKTSKQLANTDLLLNLDEGY
jgi:hypothetical protein